MAAFSALALVSAPEPAAQHPSKLLAVFATMLLQFSSSPSNCAQLVSAGVLQPITAILKGAGLRHPLTPVLIETLWNIFEGCPEARQIGRVSWGGLGDQEGGQEGGSDSGAEVAAEVAAELEAELAGVLTGLLQEALSKGYKAMDKEIRNEVLVVLVLLAQAPSFRTALKSTGRTSKNILAYRQDIHSPMQALGLATKLGAAEVPEKVAETSVGSDVPGPFPKSQYRRMPSILSLPLCFLVRCTVFTVWFVIWAAGFVELAIAASVFPEAQLSDPALVTQATLGREPEDYELKRFVWNILAALCQESCILEQATSGSFIK